MSEMNRLISEFPNNFVEAKRIASKASFRTPKNEIHNIVICGMGGSGIGGNMVSKWLENELSVPVTVVKDYNLPAFVSKNSLVIGSSYSGNTEETLGAVEEAVAKGAHIIGVTSGGEMLELC
ncbi:MAG: SIS domain-containing protein, partial [Crocinitomicaceae bacterium]|nr:SIS domain-containing protein [Crocinitomicaceae bacterium]